MNFNSTVKGSALEGFYPAGWDFEKIDACIDAPETITQRQDFWNKDFTPVKCDGLAEFETYMGHEIAMQIKLAKERKEKVAFILPVGPMGMYKWVVYFLKEWKVALSKSKGYSISVKLRSSTAVKISKRTKSGIA